MFMGVMALTNVTDGYMRAWKVENPVLSVNKCMFSSTSTRLLLKRGKDDPSNLEIDLSTLSTEERDRIEYIQKITREADEFAKLAGFPVVVAAEGEVTERGILETKWSGQSDVEVVKIFRRNPLDIISRPLLAIGDISMFAVCAAIGRANLNEDIDIISTAAPFIFSWLAISPFLGAYSREATASRVKVLTGVLYGWVFSMPAALAIRGYIKDYMPSISFIIVSMVATFTLLSAWRLLYIAAIGETSEDEYRKAGFLEVFKMVSTLIRRW